MFRIIIGFVANLLLQSTLTAILGFVQWNDGRIDRKS